MKTIALRVVVVLALPLAIGCVEVQCAAVCQRSEGNVVVSMVISLMLNLLSLNNSQTSVRR